MSRIALLSEEVASQVAAGEVVERPASVVKELVENSLDAGAGRVEVRIARGGASLVRVVDDGCGMDRDDALLCLERHATSKIRSGADLATVATLGFRGEALPSIASVSRFTLSTREHDAISGTEIVVAGGRIREVRDGGEAPGTSIEVRSLFYNLPARRKFLRAENTEAGHVEHQLHLQAIGHPGTGFSFIRDGHLVFQLPPAPALRDRIRDLHGAGFLESLIPVGDGPPGPVTVSGLIGKPGVSRASRVQQIVFVNGRAIENPAINHALREGYHTALMKGQFPVTFLFLEMDPALVDVNVHPAKREVRFRDPSLVREAVTDAVRCAIENARGSWNEAFRPGPPAISPAPASAPPEAYPETPALIPEREQRVLRGDWSSFSPAPAGPAASAAGYESVGPAAPAAGYESVGPAAPAAGYENAPDSAGGFRILGVLGKLYVLMENASGLVLVDQHAAHERILFEELRRRMEQQGVPGQHLLLPPTIAVTPKDREWLLGNLGTLQRMGIGLEEFGPSTFKLDTLPEYLMGGDPAQTVRDIIDELRQAGSGASRVRMGEDVIATTVCRHAVKAHDTLREPELVKLIEDLLACELPYCCPHGRPTMIQISHAELEKKFGRRV